MSKDPKKRRLAPAGGFDDVMTPPDLADAIVRHFRPSGWILEPCFGDGAFLTAAQYCGSLFGYEIRQDTRFGTIDFEDLGGDFLTAGNAPKVDYVVTNPPYSKFMPFLVKSMELADNVIFLAPFNHFMTRARMAAIRGYGFGIVEMLEYPQPPKPWPSSGFALGAVHLKRRWTGSTHIHAVQGI